VKAHSPSVNECCKKCDDSFLPRKISSLFSAGQIVLIDELSGAAWQTDPAGRGQIWASSNWRVVYQRHNPSQGSIDDPWPDAAGWFSRQDRVTAEVKEVQSYDATTRTVTFTSPFHISYRASHTAQLYVYPVSHVKNAGVEDLKLQGGDDGQLRFEWAAYSWAARVEDTGFVGEGFAVDNSFRVEIRDSYVHTPVWMEPGRGSYNISLSNASAEILIETPKPALGQDTNVRSIDAPSSHPLRDISTVACANSAGQRLSIERLPTPSHRFALSARVLSIFQL